MPREIIALACTACDRRNYSTTKNRRTQPDRLDLNGELARRARDLGCRFTIDSDSHGTPQRALLQWGVDQARRGWLGKEDVVNALPAGQVLKALKRR